MKLFSSVLWEAFVQVKKCNCSAEVGSAEIGVAEVSSAEVKIYAWRL
jgi:hypothetical protein